MDFSDSPEDAAYRARANAWLKTQAPLRKEGAGNENLAEAWVSTDSIPAAREWQRKKHEAGYVAINWPKSVGGQGGTPMQQVIFNQEEARFDAPGGQDTPGGQNFTITMGMAMPTLLAWASEEQKKHFVPKALRGEHIWCQLFSEPAAGSDVAGVRTRAERKDGYWLLNGQKCWTSGARFADYGILVARSDPSRPKHKGLTYFFVDMKSPGIEVHPIKQITGASNFNEVFLTDVKIPDEQRLGPVNEGWKVVITTLMNERTNTGGASGAESPALALLRLARQLELESGPAIRDQGVRERIAEWFVKTEGIRYTMYRTLTALSKGEQPGPESSIDKAVSAPYRQEMNAYAMDLMEQAGILRDPALAPFHALFQNSWLRAPGSRVAGGTDEIMRNILAERVLGLPGDIRVDKDVAFKDLPTGV